VIYMMRNPSDYILQISELENKHLCHERKLFLRAFKVNGKSHSRRMQCIRTTRDTT